MRKPEEDKVFEYQFSFPDRSSAKVTVRLDAETLAVIQDPPDPAPDWTKLAFRQCPNCPLKPAEHPLCPVAANLHQIVHVFKDAVSFNQVDVAVSSGSRQIQKTASIAEALTSLIGIYMAASGCPIMDRLRPMLLTHMPFATGLETFYRSVGTYLLGQFFIQEAGGKPDWSLKRLNAASQEIQTVNRAFCLRLKSLGIGDGIVNAVAHLDCFASLTGSLLIQRQLGKLRQLFAAYLRDR
ncbi:MAG: hypothetical protein HY554_05290 [Elusimicrobia bacterium]|nr:hypothetical protein [Elusimicrobiota bacterium]